MKVQTPADTRPLSPMSQNPTTQPPLAQVTDFRSAGCTQRPAYQEAGLKHITRRPGYNKSATRAVSYLGFCPERTVLDAGTHSDITGPNSVVHSANPPNSELAPVKDIYWSADGVFSVNHSSPTSTPAIAVSRMKRACLHPSFTVSTSPFFTLLDFPAVLLSFARK
jgi:hypothetical protein